MVFQINHVCQINLQIADQAFPAPTFEKRQALRPPGFFCCISQILPSSTWIGFHTKTNLHLWLKTTLYYTSMYPLPLSRNAKGSEHPLLYLTNSLTGVASTPNQTLNLYLHFLHRFLFKVKEKASWIGFHTKANLLLCQINLHFPNKFVSSKQISVCQRCLFVCEGEVCLNCVLS